jgi:hypothetical protein
MVSLSTHPPSGNKNPLKPNQPTQISIVAMNHQISIPHYMVILRYYTEKEC